MKVRFEAVEGIQRDQVWEHVKKRILDYLQTQGLSNISIEKSEELPMKHPKSGKLKHVWIDYQE